VNLVDAARAAQAAQRRRLEATLTGRTPAAEPPASTPAPAARVGSFDTTSGSSR
jgi:hypothetical protein